MVILVLLGTMILLAVVGLPLVFALLGSSVVTMLVFLPNVSFFTIVQLFVSGIDRQLLFAVAFFFFAGELMNRGGVTQRLVDFSKALLGSIRGGLGYVNIVTNVLFAGISGAAVADTAAVGSILIPSMIQDGYSREFSAAVTESSSVLGPIIPPSIPMIVYAMMAQQSVGGMFLGGIIPGVVMALCMMVVVGVISWQRSYPKAHGVSLRRIAVTFAKAVPAILTPVIIVGGILGGVFTATEAGAVAAFYSILAGMFVYRRLTWRELWNSLLHAARGTSAILIIVGASTIFGYLVARLEISRQFADLIFSVSRDPVAVLFMISALCLIVGLVMDPLAAIIILVPVLMPTINQIGISGIHFGVVLVLALMIGLVTPPVGYLIYMSSAIAGTEPERVVKESGPFVVALLVALIVVILVPQVTLVLPGLMK